MKCYSCQRHRSSGPGFIKLYARGSWNTLRISQDNASGAENEAEKEVLSISTITTCFFFLFSFFYYFMYCLRLCFIAKKTRLTNTNPFAPFPCIENNVKIWRDKCPYLSSSVARPLGDSNPSFLPLIPVVTTWLITETQEVSPGGWFSRNEECGLGLCNRKFPRRFWQI